MSRISSCLGKNVIFLHTGKIIQVHVVDFDNWHPLNFLAVLYREKSTTSSLASIGYIAEEKLETADTAWLVQLIVLYSFLKKKKYMRIRIIVLLKGRSMWVWMILT